MSFLAQMQFTVMLPLSTPRVALRGGGGSHIKEAHTKKPILKTVPQVLMGICGLCMAYIPEEP